MNRRKNKNKIFWSGVGKSFRLDYKLWGRILDWGVNKYWNVRLSEISNIGINNSISISILLLKMFAAKTIKNKCICGGFMLTLINMLHLLSFCSAMIVPRVDITGRTYHHNHSDRIFIHECSDLSRPRCTYSTEIQYCANYIILHPTKYDTFKWDIMGDCG